jgi:hypothetical protein
MNLIASTAFWLMTGGAYFVESIKSSMLANISPS